MTRALALFVTLASAVLGSTALSTMAVAQTATRPQPWQPADPARPAWSPRNLSSADAHRYETERLRAIAERNADLARDQSAQARRNLDLLRARGASVPAAPVSTYRVPPAVPLPAPADTRRIQPPVSTGSVNQIDDWLNRPPY